MRLIPFQFSLEQTYVLEMGQGYMRVASAGGMVLEEELLVTGISSQLQAVVTAAYHGYSEGDRVYLTGGLGAMGEALNNRFWEVVFVGGTDTFTIDADTRGLTFTGWEGGTARTTDPDPLPPDPVVPPVVTPPDPPVTGGGGTYKPPPGTQIP